jgi:transposase-like protein
MSDGDRCFKCGGSSFRRVTDEWMRRSIPWTADGIVRQCENCGEKHFVCPACSGLLTRVNITNVRVMRSKCPQCGYEDQQVRAWLAEQRE